MFVNRLQRQGFRLLITGSNANLLSSELATHLTGRHTSLVLFPFAFGEVLAASGGERTGIEKMAALDVYAEQGGYPEPLLKKIDRRDYLRNLLQSTLYYLFDMPNSCTYNTRVREVCYAEKINNNNR